MLNDFGRLVFQTDEQCVGLVVAGPFQLVYSFTFPIDSDDEEYEFWSYDVMIGDELITDVPQEFLMRMSLAAL